MHSVFDVRTGPPGTSNQLSDFRRHRGPSLSSFPALSDNQRPAKVSTIFPSDGPPQTGTRGGRPPVEARVAEPPEQVDEAHAKPGAFDPLSIEELRLFGIE